jgi:cell wall integrity and stress response component
VTTVTESADPVTTVIYPTSSPSSTATLEASSSSTVCYFSVRDYLGDWIYPVIRSQWFNTDMLQASTKTSAEEPGTTDSSTETSSSWIPTPIISLETVTGQVRTVTVTPTIPPNSQNLDDISRKEGGGGLGTGGAVGLTVGLVALVAIACAIIYFCLKKRKQQQADDYNNVGARESITGLGGQVPSRTMSENSRYILGTDGRQVVETWETDTQNTPGSRTSRLMPVDPRLDPFAPVYQRGENKSRESVNTIRDDHDYSRRVHQQAPILRATNPDQ